MQNNPMSGGPDHLLVLANAIDRDRRPEAYARPPSTGGDQISVRFSEKLLAHLDVLGNASGWTRVQVLTALVERGLFEIYELLRNETGDAIMEQLANEIAPTIHSESLLLRQAKAVAREISFDGCTISPGPRPESFFVKGKRKENGIPRMLIVIDRHTTSDFQNGTNIQKRQILEQIREKMVSKWHEALEHDYTTDPEPLRCVFEPSFFVFG